MPMKKSTANKRIAAAKKKILREYRESQRKAKVRSRKASRKAKRK